MQSHKTCPKKHHFAYDLGIRRDKDDAPLRFGDNFHLGLDLKAQGIGMPGVVERVRENYHAIPEWVEDTNAWWLECEKACRLLYGYDWYWSDDGYEVVATEQSFDLPIRNPATGAPSTVFRVGGKIDKIVRLPDGRLAVMEHKTTGFSIEDPDADYWKRTRLDHQITLYLWAARRLGHDCRTVIYDAIHKPTIEPKMVSCVDADGVKIVNDANGDRVYKRDGSPRLTGDTAKGYVLQQARETNTEYGDRLTKDIGERPRFYFQRQEVPRLESDVSEFLTELWQQQKAIRQAQLNGWHFRNTGACTSPFRCEYLDVCHGGIDLDDGPPPGFIQLDNIHPELEEINNVPTANEVAAESAAGVETCACDDRNGACSDACSRRAEA